MSQTLLRQALEAFENGLGHLCRDILRTLIERAEQEAEPVARVDYSQHGNIAWLFGPQLPDGANLFAAPSVTQSWRDTLTVNLLRQSDGLTKAQIRELIDAAVSCRSPDEALFTKEKNT